MQLALHSVSYAGVWPGQERLTLEQFIPRTAALGFKAVMLVAKRPHLSLLDYPSHRPEKRQALRALLAEHGLSVLSLAGYNDFTVGPERPDVPFWEHQIVYIAELASLARDLDCPCHSRLHRLRTCRYFLRCGMDQRRHRPARSSDAGSRFWRGPHGPESSRLCCRLRKHVSTPLRG